MKTHPSETDLYETNARNRKVIHCLAYIATHHVNVADLADALDDPTHGNIVASILAEAAGIRPMSATTQVMLIEALRREANAAPVTDLFEGLD